jgi:hypothetical protein
MTADPQVEEEHDAGAELGGAELGGAELGGVEVADGGGATEAEGVVGDDVEFIDDMPPPHALMIASSTATTAGRIDCCTRCMDVSPLRDCSKHGC